MSVGICLPAGKRLLSGCSSIRSMLVSWSMAQSRRQASEKSASAHTSGQLRCSDFQFAPERRPIVLPVSAAHLLRPRFATAAVAATALIAASLGSYWLWSLPPGNGNSLSQLTRAVKSIDDRRVSGSESVNPTHRNSDGRSIGFPRTRFDVRCDREGPGAKDGYGDRGT